MKKWMKYGMTALAILAAAVFLAWRRDIFSAEDAGEIMGICSDCILVPGILSFGIGALSWAASKGAYDMLSFGSGSMARWIVPGMDKSRYDDFYEYKLEKEKNGRKWSPHLFFCGLAAIGVAVLFYAAYLLLQ